MKLSELVKKVGVVVGQVLDDGHTPEEIDVTIQLDGEEGSICSREHIAIEYDNFTIVSGCVINGAIEKDKIE